MLTGTWQANDFGVYEMHQSGSCLYWFGRSEYIDSEPGEYFANVLYGTVQSDFTISGHWGDVRYHPSGSLNNGEIALRIDFDSSGGTPQPVLRATGATGGFGGTAWVRAETVPPAEEITGVLDGDFDDLFQTGCVWIESAGTQYELLGLWDLLQGDGTTVRVNTEEGFVVAETGDPIRVVGRVAAPLGTCTDSAVLVETLERAQ